MPDFQYWVRLSIFDVGNWYVRAMSGRSSLRFNVWGRRMEDIRQFGRAEPRGGGWGVVEECGRGGRFRWYMEGWKVCINRWPGGDGMDRTFGCVNSLFFVGIAGIDFGL